MAFTATSPAHTPATFAASPSLGPSPTFAEDTDAELEAAASELLGLVLAKDADYSSTARGHFLQGAVQCLRELEARALWPAPVAALDDAAEAALERGERI